MSKRSRHKKGKAQTYKGPRERPKKPQTEEPQAEEFQTEEPQTEEPQAEGLQAEEAQTKEPQTEEPQTKEPQTEEPQTEEPQTKEPQTEEPQAEEPPERSDGKSGPPPAPEKAMLKKKQKITMVVMIVLAVVMVIAAALALLHNRWFKRPALPLPPGPSVSGGVPPTAFPSFDPVNPGPEVSSDVITVEPLASGERKSKDFYTVLIFGSDESSGLTDTIMVASYDVTNQKATVLSIPRDTLVNNSYLDKANKSINAIYKQNGKGEQGTAALKTEISWLIGFVPDFYVTINWELVGKMVDAIDGVEFNVPWRMKYDDPTQNLHIDLRPGLQTLDGEHAMQLVRWRKNNSGVASSDLNRLNVQHDFLKAVLKQTLQPQNIVRIPELIRLFNENVVSDLVVENMLWFGEQAVLGGLSVDDVEFVTMPVYGTDNTGGRYYGKVCPIIDQLLAMVNGSLNPYVQDVTIQQLDLIQMSADGNILSSTTGTLRNPSSGVYKYPDGPTASNPPKDGPVATDPPKDGPVATDPPEDGPDATDPPKDDPVVTDPPEDGLEATGPAGDDPGPVQTDDPPPETGPMLPEVDGPDNGDWGYTPE